MQLPAGRGILVSSGGQMKNDIDWESLAFDAVLLWSWPVLLAAVALSWLT